MSEKIPKLSANLYQKLAQLLTDLDQKSGHQVELTPEEKAIHHRYFEAFKNGQAKATIEQDHDEEAA